MRDLVHILTLGMLPRQSDDRSPVGMLMMLAAMTIIIVFCEAHLRNWPLRPSHLLRIAAISYGGSALVMCGAFVAFRSESRRRKAIDAAWTSLLLGAMASPLLGIAYRILLDASVELQ